MKSIKKSIFPLAIIALILLASPGAAGHSEKTTGSKNTLAPTGAGTLNREAIMAKAASLAVPFVRNAGRFNKEVRYSADLFSGRFFLTDKELVYSLRKWSGKKNSGSDGALAFKEFFIDGKRGRISFMPAGEEKGMTKVSYFRGNDPAKWQSGLASNNCVSLGDIYPGIQVKLRASGKNVEKIFYVSPGSDVAKIKIGVAGIKGLKITKDGRLLFKNTLGELAMRAPVAWQEIAGRRRKVKVSYRLSGKKFYGFKISGDYDKNQPLVIDPELDTLLVSTFLGGSYDDRGNSLVLDSSGNVYLAGNTSSEDFPTTIGAYDRTINPIKHDDYPYGDYYPDDVFISKLSGDLTELLASTYLGGNRDDPYAIGWDNDYASSISLDSSGNVYVAGSTNSPDFPTTPGAYDRTHKGEDGGDVFVAKLNGNLTKLLASTFIGGSSSDGCSSLALDHAGNVCLTGCTSSTDFPTTGGAFDQTYNDDHDSDVFVSKLNGNLTKLLASTFLGGNGSDGGRFLALDGKGYVYLIGTTESADFPTTPEAYDRTFNDADVKYGLDLFISKMNSDLTKLMASTYLGGSGSDVGQSLALDHAGNVYLTGSTASADFPTTPGAYDRTYNSIHVDYPIDIFISKLNSNLTTLSASTFLGGDSSDAGHSLALDGEGNVYVTGYTFSTNFPTTSGAYDRTRNYYYDAFIAKLNSGLTNLLAATLLGGSDYDGGDFLVLDRAGNVCVIGRTSSTNFPTTPGAYDREQNQGVFISKLNGRLNGIAVISPNGGESWVAGTVHDITWGSTGKIAGVRIELSTDNGSSWSEVSVSPARYHKFSWTVSNTPSRKCLVRISDIDNTILRDSSDAMFSILMNIDLVAERREVRAFSIVRQYGRIQFLIGNASVPVAQYRIMRHRGNEDFIVLKAITPAELQNNQFQMQDKYLEKGATYTYRVEAYDAAGQMIGISSEKTI